MASLRGETTRLKLINISFHHLASTLQSYSDSIFSLWRRQITSKLSKQIVRERKWDSAILSGSITTKPFNSSQSNLYQNCLYGIKQDERQNVHQDALWFTLDNMIPHDISSDKWQVSSNKY